MRGRINGWTAMRGRINGWIITWTAMRGRKEGGERGPCKHPYTSVVAPCRHPTCTNMFEIRVPVNALIHFSFGCRKCPRATQATHLLRKNARTQRTQPPLCRGPHPLDQRYRSKHRILSVQKNSRGPSAQARWFPAEGLALVQDFPCAGLPLRRWLSAEQASKLRGLSRPLQCAPLRR